MAVEVGVARETAPGERRVALTPETCKKLVKAGAAVRIERDAGASAGFTDADYTEASDVVDAEADRLVAAGASLISSNEEHGVYWKTLRDPEGNEFCVGTPLPGHSLDDE